MFDELTDDPTATRSEDTALFKELTTRITSLLAEMVNVAKISFTLLRICEMRVCKYRVTLLTTEVTVIVVVWVKVSTTCNAEEMDSNKLFSPDE